MTPRHVIKSLPALSAALLLVALAACSTTKHLPEGEQLYTGIAEINYGDKPRKAPKGSTAQRDSAGVITSIGESIAAIDDLLEGRTQVASVPQKPDTKALSREEKKKFEAAYEAEKAAFETAQTEVDAVLAYPPNNALFGSSSLRSPFPFGLWMYNALVTKQGGAGRWLFKHFATQPVLVSNVAPQVRARVATNTLHNYGYFGGRVTPRVLTQRNPRKAKIAYEVEAGKLYRLDSVEYRNFPARADSLLRATHSKRLLHKGDAFSVVNLSDEQLRIEQLFREHGYYYYTAAHTTYTADTLRRPGYVQLRVQPDPLRPDRVRHPWYIGQTFITMRKVEREPLTKTTTQRGYTFSYNGDKMPLRAGMWRRAMGHRRGDTFRLSYSKFATEKINALGVLSSYDINYVPRDTSATCDTLDIYITAVLDKRYDSSFEMNATMKSNQQVGPGMAFSLARRNAFRGAEKILFNVFGSYEWQTGAGRDGGNSLLNSYELGTELAFEFPRFVLPFVGRRHLRFPASTKFALNGDWKNRAGFFNLVSVGLSATYNWHKRPTALHELALLNFDFDKLLHTTADFDAIMRDNPTLAVSMRDQFIPSVGYTFTYTSSAKHRNPMRLQLSVKEAGNLASAIYAATGRTLDTPDKTIFKSPFAQFVKGTAEASANFKLSSRLRLATRAFGGVVYSYGNSTRAPYSEQFYTGGANGVRAFTVRSIGPGAYRSDNSKYAYIDQTGDVKLEANVELRAQLFGSLYGAAFLDAGNVWLLRNDPMRPSGRFSMSNLHRVAVGTGGGLRYDLDFLVLRFDVGVPLHAPYNTGRSGWYNIPRLGRSLAYHFAIGYPF